MNKLIINLNNNFLLKFLTKWLNDYKFEIQLSVNTKVYATAWNAYWARAEAKMDLTEIKFS